MKKNHASPFSACLGSALLFGLSLGLSACAVQPTVPAGTDLVLLHANATLVENANALLAQSDYIIVAEQHNSASHHQAQARILERVLAQGRHPVLALEMLPYGKASSAQNRSSHDPAAALTAFVASVDWPASWGYTSDLYAPVLQTALQAGLDIEGINLPQSLTRKVSLSGLDSLNPAEEALLPPEILPLPADQVLALNAVRQRHALRAGLAETMPSLGIGIGSGVQSAPQVSGGKLALEQAMTKARTESTLNSPAMQARAEAFNLVMSLWDSAMGYNAVQLHRKSQAPVFILAGQGHAANGWGIGRTLRHFDPQARIVTLLPWSDSVQANSPDYFYLCPTTE